MEQWIFVQLLLISCTSLSSESPLSFGLLSYEMGIIPMSSDRVNEAVVNVPGTICTLQLLGLDFSGLLLMSF